jgi:hypothetical protein
MTTKDATGQTVKIGDIVEFKADIEQCGEVVEIKRAEFGGGHRVKLKATREDGFEGGYIGGDQFTWETSDRIYL